MNEWNIFLKLKENKIVIVCHDTKWDSQSKISPYVQFLQNNMLHIQKHNFSKKYIQGKFLNCEEAPYVCHIISSYHKYGCTCLFVCEIKQTIFASHHALL